jgi:hypothetical protein
MKTRTLHLTLAILLVPVLALAAGPPEPAAAPACGQLAVQITPAPAPEEALALSPRDGVIAMAGPNCCHSLQQQCAANCRNKGGISEFNCFPESCTASCLCNVFP